MESIAGDSGSSSNDDDSPPNENEESPDATAGLRLTLLDNLQPPVTFFTGMSELMAAAWSGTGEEMTVFEGQFLLNDLHGVVPMANGQTAVIEFGSALWWKMSSTVELSLWYRNAHTVISSQ